jgi:hypothetical protein
MYFESHRSGRYAIYSAERADLSSPFSNIQILENVNSPGPGPGDGCPYLPASGRALYFCSYRTGSDLYRSARQGTGFAPPVAIIEANSLQYESMPVVSPDELVLYFSSTRVAPGTLGKNDIWMAVRASVDEPFGEPINILELSSEYDELPNWVSYDGCRLYFQRKDSAGVFSLYVSSRFR